MSKAMEAILDKTGVNYTVMSGVDSCCGAVTAGTGNLEAAKKMAVKNIRNARERGVKKLSPPVPDALRPLPPLYPEFVTMDFEVLQSSQYLKILIDEGRIKLNEIPAKVFYHDPCHLTRGMGVYEAPREILNKIPGTVLINPSTKGSACCGFGGGVRGNFPSDSMELAGDRHRYAKALGSDILITNCAGCLQNLLEGKKDSDLDIFDLAEYVAAAMGIEKTSTEEEDRETIQLINTVYSQCLPHYPEK